MLVVGMLNNSTRLVHVRNTRLKDWSPCRRSLSTCFPKSYISTTHTAGRPHKDTQERIKYVYSEAYSETKMSAVTIKNIFFENCPSSCSRPYLGGHIGRKRCNTWCIRNRTEAFLAGSGSRTVQLTFHWLWLVVGC